MPILPAIGGQAIARVTPTDIARLLNGLHQQVSAAKVDHVDKTLSAMFHAAEQDDLIHRVPTRPKKHRPRRQQNPHVVHVRPQARRMLLQLRGWYRDTALLQLALGARFSEIAGPTPHDIEGGRVHIRRRVAKATVRATKNHRAHARTAHNDDQHADPPGPRGRQPAPDPRPSRTGSGRPTSSAGGG